MWHLWKFRIDFKRCYSTCEFYNSMLWYMLDFGMKNKAFFSRVLAFLHGFSVWEGDTVVFFPERCHFSTDLVFGRGTVALNSKAMAFLHGCTLNSTDVV